jgi:plastocyanin
MAPKVRLPHRLGVLLLTVGVLQAGIGLSAPAGAETHTVRMEGVKFVPETLTVKRGDVVVWVNKDLFPHTATGEKREFDSGNIAPDQSWKYTATKAGTFSYVCTLHPTMKGALIVR